MSTLEIFTFWAGFGFLALSLIAPAFGAGKLSRYLTYLAFGLITLSLITRGVDTGHGPFSSMYEFGIAFAWGIVGAGIFFEWRYKTSVIKNLSSILAILLMLFAWFQPSRVPSPLVPALQQSVLLSVHVAVAIVAYGTFAMGFIAALLYIIKNRTNASWIPELDMLGNISYTTVIIGFPFLTATIVLGALWADIAWGRYWSWDPKETASLVTWLLYAGYLHARVMRGWRGNRIAWLLIIGFFAVIFTFFGNFIFTGLHAYGTG